MVWDRSDYVHLMASIGEQSRDRFNTCLRSGYLRREMLAEDQDAQEDSE
jgi:hypothetical protein